MKPEQIVRELYDAFNQRDFERAAAAFAESCEYKSIALRSVMRTGADVAVAEAAKIVCYRDCFDRARMNGPLGLMHLIAGWPRVDHGGDR